MPIFQAMPILKEAGARRSGRSQEIRYEQAQHFMSLSDRDTPRTRASPPRTRLLSEITKSHHRATLNPINAHFDQS